MKKINDLRDLSVDELLIYSVIRMSESLQSGSNIGYREVHYKISELMKICLDFSMTESDFLTAFGFLYENEFIKIRSDHVYTQKLVEYVK